MTNITTNRGVNSYFSPHRRRTFEGRMRILAVIVLLVLSMADLGRLGLLLRYAGNVSLFEEHCVNQNDPSMQCKGQCQLSAELQDLEESPDKNSPAEQKKEKEPVQYLISSGVKTESSLDLNCTRLVNYICPDELQGCSNELLKPPILFS